MVAMSKPARADYGVDAPIAVRNMLIVCALGIISLITRAAGLWGKESTFALLGRPLISAGLACGAMACWMICSSKFGKVRERETYLDLLAWRGDERVLDVGCGRGLFLIGAAKRLTTGRAIGIDIWQAEDLSGNDPAATSNNAMIEEVADRVEVQTADARKLPFDDASFDVVLSSAALHNIYNAGERRPTPQAVCPDAARGWFRRRTGCSAQCAEHRVLPADDPHVRLGASRLRDRQQGAVSLWG
jgi:SAM-dependent methyltransferase